MMQRSIACVMLGFGAALAVAEDAEQGGVKWITSYEEAKATAAKCGKIMMIDFYGEH